MIIKKIEETNIPSVKIITPEIFIDDRGYFFETFNKEDFIKLNLPTNFTQDNQAFSKKGTLRGFHYQLKFPQGKLVRVIKGEVLDVAVDIRKGSPTFGEYVGVNLTEENFKIMYIPEGFAHGYIVLSEDAIFQYKCTDVYHPDDEYGLLWNDDKINVEWPINNPILSERDKYLPMMKNIPINVLPEFKRI
jgi:dTDP-4-dehydrorhamnose 3,5-epimerase